MCAYVHSVRIIMQCPFSIAISFYTKIFLSAVFSSHKNDLEFFFFIQSCKLLFVLMLIGLITSDVNRENVFFDHLYIILIPSSSIVTPTQMPHVIIWTIIQAPNIVLSNFGVSSVQNHQADSKKAVFFSHFTETCFLGWLHASTSFIKLSNIENLSSKQHHQLPLNAVIWWIKLAQWLWHLDRYWFHVNTQWWSQYCSQAQFTWPS